MIPRQLRRTGAGARECPRAELVSERLRTENAQGGLLVELGTRHDGHAVGVGDDPVALVNEHVAHAYGNLKAAMVARYMPNATRAQRGQFLETWINQATGLRLGVNENDIWICSQALERDIFVMSADGDFERIREAEPRLRLILLNI